ncbi:MAG: methyltransferase domain-containing protein [Candidatus Omnitrophota bacterium]|jgi:ubiquinone/menaquinone biosynthesis C-methylase UbiE
MRLAKLTDEIIENMFSIYNARYFDKIALSIPGYREITDKLVQQIEKKPYCTVLDMGAGTGRIALKLADGVFKVVALDNSEEMLGRLSEKARRRRVDNIQIVKKDITSWELLWPNTDLILGDGVFTSVICSFVLHHLRDKWKKVVLGQLRKSMKPDGQIIIADVRPEKAWQIRKQVNVIYWKLIHEKENKYPGWLIAKNALSYLFFEHSLSADAWKELLREAGYKNAKCEICGDFVLAWANN